MVNEAVLAIPSCYPISHLQFRHAPDLHVEPRQTFA
jgi:hypothetical protein